MKDLELPPSLGICGNTDVALNILSRIWGKRGVFTCTVGNTMTSTIPGISDAGDTPDLTLFTPAADAEMLVLGRTVCMKGIPINPGGIPTPATLTMAALQLTDMPLYIVDGGTKIKPNLPCFDVGGTYGESILTGKAVKNVRESYERGKILGEMLSKTYDFIVVSESCAGGTTTALAVMMAMGVLKENLVSSSSPNNPRELKTKVVSDSLAAAGIKIGDLANDPLKAIECVGDPMMPANIGMIVGAAKRVPVIVGGGTQMAAVIAAAVALDDSVVGNIFQGTTRWLVNDPKSDIRKIMESVHKDVPIVYVNMDYSESPYEGLQAYEWGYIKEGVGCGGSCVAAIAQSSGNITCAELLDKVHDIYKGLLDL
ncbi:MAG: TIGR00303 family protein [Methanomassiliicoccaceae archaeon]|nr:TIGR00303 family protein [Methanomassiliicoccaceae archaeon]